jgi:hypothetical protein
MGLQVAIEWEMCGQRTSLSHQFLCYTQTTVRSHHTQTGDVAVWHSIRRIFLHLCEHISDDAWVVVGGFLGARDVDCNVGELGPGEGVVEVIFHKITERSVWLNGTERRRRRVFCVSSGMEYIKIGSGEGRDKLFREICDIGMLNMRNIGRL